MHYVQVKSALDVTAAERVSPRLPAAEIGRPVHARLEAPTLRGLDQRVRVLADTCDDGWALGDVDKQIQNNAAGPLSGGCNQRCQRACRTVDEERPLTKSSNAWRPARLPNDPSSVNRFA